MQPLPLGLSRKHRKRLPRRAGTITTYGPRLFDRYELATASCGCGWSRSLSHYDDPQDWQDMVKRHTFDCRGTRPTLQSVYGGNNKRKAAP